MTPLQARLKGQEIFSTNLAALTKDLDERLVEAYARDPDRAYIDIDMDQRGSALGDLLSPDNAYVRAIQQHYGEQGWTVRFFARSHRKFWFQPKKG